MSQPWMRNLEILVGQSNGVSIICDGNVFRRNDKLLLYML
jgi:hypothetical protein